MEDLNIVLNILKIKHMRIVCNKDELDTLLGTLMTPQK